MRRKVFYIIFTFCFSGLSYAQITVPTVGDTLHVYSTKLDRAMMESQDLQFYTIDFPCLSKLRLIESEVPRIDFELKDESSEKSLLINLADGNMLLKGFRMRDPYFQLSEKYIQLIKGIPLINLDSIQDFNNSGSENYFLEYKITDLPEEIQNWAFIREYDKLRVKVSIDYETAYQGVELVGLMGGMPHYKLYIKYVQKVSEIQMKNIGWEKVNLSEVPLSDQHFMEVNTEYVSYHQGDDPFGSLMVFEQPELRIQYQLKAKEKNLPNCVNSDEQVYVYPNPSFGKLNIRMVNAAAGVYTFDLYNIIGTKVWSTSFSNAEQDLFNLELPDLEKGIYLYGIKDRNGRNVQSRRLTIIEY